MVEGKFSLSQFSSDVNIEGLSKTEFVSDFSLWALPVFHLLSDEQVLSNLRRIQNVRIWILSAGYQEKYVS